MRGTAVDDAANRGRTVAATEARRRQGAARLATILAVRIDDLDDKMLAALASAVDAEITERGIVVPSI